MVTAEVRGSSSHVRESTLLVDLFPGDDGTRAPSASVAGTARRRITKANRSRGKTRPRFCHTSGTSGLRAATARSCGASTSRAWTRPARAATQPRGARASVWKRGGRKSFLRPPRRSGPSPRTPSSVAARRWSPPSRRGSSTRHRSSAACEAWRLPPRRNSAYRVSRVSRRTRFQGETSRRRGGARSLWKRSEGFFDVVPRNVRGGRRDERRGRRRLFSMERVSRRGASRGDGRRRRRRVSRRAAIRGTRRGFQSSVRFGFPISRRAAPAAREPNRRFATNGRRGTCDSRSKCPRPSRRDPRRSRWRFASRAPRWTMRRIARPPRPRTRMRSRRSRTSSAPSRTTRVWRRRRRTESIGGVDGGIARTPRRRRGARAVRGADLARGGDVLPPARRGGCRGGSRDSDAGASGEKRETSKMKRTRLFF